jgi:hypothetical protein
MKKIAAGQRSETIHCRATGYDLTNRLNRKTAAIIRTGIQYIPCFSSRMISV